MKRMTSLTLILAITSLDATGADLTDPVEILKKADAATKAVKSAKYEVSLRGEGAAEARVPAIDGTMISVGSGDPAASPIFRQDVTTKRPGSEETKRITAGGDGENYYLIDHDEKKAYVDMDPQVVGSAGRILFRAAMAEFVHPAPFSDELNADKKELIGSKTVEGVDCYEIHVHYAGGRGEAVWCFSKKDFLPRARRDVFTDREGKKGAFVKTVKNLVVDPKLEKDAMKFKLPDGYTRVDDFAP